MSYSFTAIIAYLLGSVPFGIVIARVFGLGDLRKIGSGNIGATNVLRTGHKFAAFLTLILDSGKGGTAVLFAYHFYGAQAAQIAALASFVGHIYPVWLGFKGGKGVATFLGTMLALSPLLGLCLAGTWLTAAILGRISSLSALCAAIFSPLWAWAIGAAQLSPLCALLAALIIFTHRENIKRIWGGTEPRIGAKKASS